MRGYVYRDCSLFLGLHTYLHVGHIVGACDEGGGPAEEGARAGGVHHTMALTLFEVEGVEKCNQWSTPHNDLHSFEGGGME